MKKNLKVIEKVDDLLFHVERLIDLEEAIKPLQEEINNIKSYLKKSSLNKIETENALVSIYDIEKVKIIKNTDDILSSMKGQFDLCFKLEAKLEDSKILKKLAESNKEIQNLFVVETSKGIRITKK